MLARKLRRKSSSFRPSTFYALSEIPTPLPSSPAKLDVLPVQILALVCANLKSSDLLNLGLVLKLLYLPAMMQLYRKIVVSPSMQSIHMCRVHLGDILVNFGTFIQALALPNLCKVLMEHPKLSTFVRSFVFLHLIDWDEVCRGVHAWLYDPTKTYVSSSLGSFVLPVLNRLPLTELYLPSWNFQQLNYERVSRLTISLNSIKSCSSDIKLPKLTHLKMYYHNDSTQEMILEKFAENIYKSGSTVVLTCLEFEAPAKPSMRFVNDLLVAIWMTFFRVVNGLKLQSLALDGYIANQEATIASIIAASTDLTFLQDLQLNTTERTHQYEAHADLDYTKQTFIESITKRSPNISQLAINPTHDCLFCQMESVKQVLGVYLVDKLVTLLLILDSPNLELTQAVNKTIMESQKQLRNLKFHDKLQEVTIRKELARFIDPEQVNLYEKALYFDTMLKDNVYRSFFLYEIESISTKMSQRRNSIVLNDLMVRFVRQNHRQLARYLFHKGKKGGELVIEKFGFTKALPDLQVLCLFGINLYLDHVQGKILFIMNDAQGYIDVEEGNGEEEEEGELGGVVAMEVC